MLCRYLIILTFFCWFGDLHWNEAFANSNDEGVKKNQQGSQTAEGEEPSLWEKVKRETNKGLNRVGKSARKVEKKVKKKMLETRDHRAQKKWSLLFNYNLIDLWIPSKWGFTGAFIIDTGSSLELEYTRGSVSVPLLVEDLGSMTEQRLALLYRNYGDRNSFNFFVGADYYKFDITLGDSLLNTVTGGVYPNIELLTIESLGLLGGIGNRWQMQNGLTIGVDWFVIDIPIYIIQTKADFLLYTSDANSKKEVEDALGFIEHIPRLAFLRFQIGMSF